MYIGKSTAKSKAKWKYFFTIQTYKTETHTGPLVPHIENDILRNNDLTFKFNRLVSVQSVDMIT